MKNIAKQLITALAGLFGPTSGNTIPNPKPAGPPPAPEPDDILFCSHPRHGAFPVRRKYKATDVSAHGHKFVIFQCQCGEFVARTLDPVTGRDHILFRGKYYRPNFSPRRDIRHTPPFRPIRAASPAS